MPPTAPATAGGAPRPEVRVDRAYFQTKEEVFQDMAKTGFWPTTYESTASPELPLHWHDGDTIGYLVEGKTYILDGDGRRLDLAAGDRLVVPAGALHAEGKVVDPVTYIVTTRQRVSFFDAFKMLDPAAYPDPRPLRVAPSAALARKFGAGRGGAAPPGAAGAEAAGVQRFYDEYIRAFNAADAGALADCSLYPTVLMGGRAVASRGEAVRLWAAAREKLRAEGFSHSVMAPCAVQPVAGSPVAIVTTSGRRYKTDGSVMLEIPEARYLVLRQGERYYMLANLGTRPKL